MVNTPALLELRASGGTTPYRWSASGLPAGLSLDAATGVVSGTPSVAGLSRVTVTVTDQAGRTDTAAFTWTVTEPGDGCLGHETTRTGSLSSGDSDYQPNGSYFHAPSGTHRADLCGPAGTDFDLYLQRWNGYYWADVDEGITPGNTETITYTGTSGYYRYQIHAYSGNGDYTLGYTAP